MSKFKFKPGNLLRLKIPPAYLGQDEEIILILAVHRAKNTFGKIHEYVNDWYEVLLNDEKIDWRIDYVDSRYEVI